MGKDIPRGRRIKHRKEIVAILRGGRKYNFSTFDIICRANQEENDRFAVLVSRRNGNAVRRNTLKRVFREMFRQFDDEIGPFYDILFRPRTGPTEELREIDGYGTWRRGLRSS